MLIVIKIYGVCDKVIIIIFIKVLWSFISYILRVSCVENELCLML